MPTCSLNLHNPYLAIFRWPLILNVNVFHCHHTHLLHAVTLCVSLSHPPPHTHTFSYKLLTTTCTFWHIMHRHLRQRGLRPQEGHVEHSVCQRGEAGKHPYAAMGANSSTPDCASSCLWHDWPHKPRRRLRLLPPVSPWRWPGTLGYAGAEAAVPANGGPDAAADKPARDARRPSPLPYACMQADLARPAGLGPHRSSTMRPRTALTSMCGASRGPRSRRAATSTLRGSMACEAGSSRLYPFWWCLRAGGSTVLVLRRGRGRGE